MKPSLAFDRWDYGVTRVLLLGALVGVPLLVVGLPLLSWVTGDALVWTAALDEQGVVSSPEVRNGVEAVWDGSAVVTVAEASAGLRILTLLPSVVVAVAVVLIAWPLLTLVRTIQRGDSFSSTAVTRLRVIGLTLLLAPWLHHAFAGFANAAVLERAFGSPEEFFVVVDGSALAISALGLAVGALAEAFRQGVRLRDDVDGLV